jgi:hypothetical protein
MNLLEMSEASTVRGGFLSSIAKALPKGSLGRRIAGEGIMLAVYSGIDAAIDKSGNEQAKKSLKRFKESLEESGYGGFLGSKLWFKKPEDLVKNVPLDAVLTALVDSGLYLSFRDFFRENQLEVTPAQAAVIQQIRDLTDEDISAILDEDSLGEIGGQRISQVLHAEGYVTKEIAKIDELVGILGLSSRKQALRVRALLSDDGIDQEMELLPNLETR